MLKNGFMAEVRAEQGLEQKPMRKSRWSDEEEEYARQLIAAFYGGGRSFLSISPGTSLYKFLSAELFR